MIVRLQRAMLALLMLSACLKTVLAAIVGNTPGQYITYVNAEGETVYLNNDREPSLYTGNYGSCLSDSVVNFTRFDAAYYHDNMTVLFNVQGTTSLYNESIMLYISIYAYGETRLTFIFNPCHTNVDSLCPLNSSVPINAQGILPVSPSDLAGVPKIATAIPDFEGQAILRIFANSTQAEIACFTAVLTNGKTFGHPDSIGTALGFSAIVAMIASFVTAVYGVGVPTMRLHYAHSLSAGVVFAVYQHIFFTGALSMNWPSVLVAWWSNFAWAGGMINVRSMQNSINKLVGNNIGSTSEVGAAPSDTTQLGIGGGSPNINEIYKRTAGWLGGLHSTAVQHSPEHAVARRALEQPLAGYTWYGHPVGPGLPLPGNYSGFAGTLAEEDIPVSNAFLTGFLWFLILLTGLVVLTVLLKWTLELFALIRVIEKDRLQLFRDHWLGYTAAVALRTCYLAWFAIMFLAIFELKFSSAGRVKAVAAVVFAVFFIGLVGAAVYACYYKVKYLPESAEEQQEPAQGKTLLASFLSLSSKSKTLENTQEAQEESKTGEKTTGTPKHVRTTSAGSIVDVEENSGSIHDNVDYTQKFGWLASRFRRSKWWFFSAWLFYEFARAVFYAGASGKPLVQVFGLLVIEILAFCATVWARPFEGRRLNILVVYCLGFSKVTCVALSSAFDIHFNLQRITTTIIGIVIIVIQGVLVIITLVAILVGAISSHMSVTRHRDYHPHFLSGIREKYFDHLDRVYQDVRYDQAPEESATTDPKPAATATVPGPEYNEAEKPGFEVKSIKRLAKIEDEDEDNEVEATPFPMLGALNHSMAQIDEDAITPVHSGTSTPLNYSRANSMRSMHSAYSASASNLPFGARPHKKSWSVHDIHATWRSHSEEPPISAIAGRPRAVTFDQRQDLTALPEQPQSLFRSSSGRKITRAASVSQIRPTPSSPARSRPVSRANSLRVGGDVSTIDTIGNVPMPTIRPRAGTAGSLSSRAPSFDFTSSDRGFSGGSGSLSVPSSRPGTASASRPNVAKVPLTPAQELDEWVANNSEPGKR